MKQATGYVHDLGDGLAEVELLVPTMHCAGCMGKVERALKALAPGVEAARTNLSRRRVRVQFRPQKLGLDDLIRALKAVGYEASPFMTLKGDGGKNRLKSLLIAMGVAGFATANIMLLSVSVWDGGEMEGETRALFHGISALIALLGIAVAGQPFFKSAWSALKVRQVNMDVPISLAVLLSYGASVVELAKGGAHVYFDAGVMLLFFLLIGRTLDEMMRGRAVRAAEELAGLQMIPAERVIKNADGTYKSETLPANEVPVGALVRVASGMRVPVDGRIIQGSGLLDMSLVTGESLAEPVKIGDKAYQGTLNMGEALILETEKRGEATLLGEIIRLMDTAEQSRGRYVRLADRFARLYAPLVHGLAGLAFVGVWALTGDPYEGLLRAIAVLIITCPCALGLAVPVVQVVASARLMQAGILLKSGDALEKLASISHVVFDKTGSLTLGEMTLVERPVMDDKDFQLAASLAALSRHPLAEGLARAAGDSPLLMFAHAHEEAGKGMSAEHDGQKIYLGSAEFVGLDLALTERMPKKDKAESPDQLSAEQAISFLWFKKEGSVPVSFAFSDQLRPDALAVIGRLKKMGLSLSLVSGDRAAPVKAIAKALAIDDWHAGVKPAGKIAFVEDLKAKDIRVLMVGDGLNDAPALRAADVSLSPASGSDVAQTASDAVFQGRSLKALPELLGISRRANHLVRQNFGLALLYNMIAIPLAFLGFVTPLVAAIAMSSSSLVVILNALRLQGGMKGLRAKAPDQMRVEPIVGLIEGHSSEDIK